MAEEEKISEGQLEGATELCPNCLKEIGPRALYCPHCKATFGLEPYNPFPSEAARIHLRPLFLIMVLMMICVYFTWLSLIIVPFCIGLVIRNRRLQTKTRLAVLIVIGLLLAYSILRKIINGEFFWPLF